MTSGIALEDPWWFSPSISQIYVHTKALRRCKLHPLFVQKIIATMANARYPTRPKRARKKWVEPVYAEGAIYQLSCYVDEKARMIVVTNIRLPKKMRKTFRHK